jgi:serine/threonine protein kinase
VDFQAETQCAVLMRPFESKGSLRDYINRTNPKVDFNVKYKNGEAVGDSITEKKIAKFGRQILEGLHYMHTMGLSHLNLNAGNVIVDNSVCTLTDCENSMLGFVPRNHQLIVPLVQQYQKVFSKEVEQEHIEMTPSEKEDTPLLGKHCTGFNQTLAPFDIFSIF